MQLELADKVVIVTGASRGIGAAIARAFAAEGARLLLNHLRDTDAMATVAEACRAAGAQTEVLRGDVADPATADALVELAQERFGQLDVLVNNAGYVVESLLATQEPEEIERQINTNVLGVVHLSRAALRPMLRQRRGCIINLSSALAQKPVRGSSVYAGSKGFVEAFTRALAVEVGRKSVRVNAVAPGVIDTDMTRAVQALAEDEVKQHVALGRIGTPDDVASMVVFLASGQASYAHGAVVALDGAFSGGA
jgi:3-oxoacyl-[acyl-carrier protein] reductase